MAKLEEGSTAPAFTLPDQDGKPVKLSDFKGQQVIVYFYPADDTPGCTKEACQFNDNLKTFEKAGVAVLGISPDGAVRRLGGEDDVRQEDGGNHSLHLPRRPQRQNSTRLVPRASRRPCRQGARGDFRGVTAQAGRDGPAYL